MPQNSHPRRPLANRVAEHINTAGIGSDFALRDRYTGIAREPDEVSRSEHDQLLRAMLVAVLKSVQEIAADVDGLFDRFR
jgi:hypothetical protein